LVVFPGLCLLPPGREPGLAPTHGPELDDHDGARWAVAWRQLALRRVWSLPGTAADRPPPDQGAVVTASAVGTAKCDVWPVVGMGSVGGAGGRMRAGAPFCLAAVSRDPVPAGRDGSGRSRVAIHVHRPAHVSGLGGIVAQSPAGGGV